MGIPPSAFEILMLPYHNIVFRFPRQDIPLQGKKEEAENLRVSGPGLQTQHRIIDTGQCAADDRRHRLRQSTATDPHQIF
jgi:hypothetical protein